MCTKDEKENTKKRDDVDFQVLKLTDLFYDTYSSKKYPEILVKKQRGYNCLLIQSHYDYFICVPFRSDIRHKYAFLFKDTVRSKKHSSGLDYTKSIIVKNPDYITSYDALIDKDEYMKTQKYIDKIKELEDKLKLVEKDKANVLEREQNTRAGYVYIISNIGSFGENVYKIGMTRRLEPLDRVKELGDASVPFEFDVHAMIFSEDAPTLETTLHNTFKANQVNKVNPRKEFFRVSLPEIEKVVKENHNATVTFTQVAKAEQYRESLRLAEAAV